MHRVRFAVVLTAFAALSACGGATRSGTGSQRAQSRDDVVCTSEAQTGSHLVETRCLTRGEIEDRRKADNELIERAVINANRPARPLPGQTPSH